MVEYSELGSRDCKPATPLLYAIDANDGPPEHDACSVGVPEDFVKLTLMPNHLAMSVKMSCCVCDGPFW